MAPDEYTQIPRHQQIHAMQLTRDNAADMADWCNGQVVMSVDPTDPSTDVVGVNVPSLPDPIRVMEGEYLVFVRPDGYPGFFVVYKAPVFESRYVKKTRD